MSRVAMAVMLLMSSLVLAEPPAMPAVPVSRPVTQPAHPLPDLLEKIPAKLSEDPNAKSYEVVGELHAMLPIRFRVVRQSAEKGMLYVDYAADGVPMLVGVNGEAIVYDAAAGVVRRVKDTRSYLELWAEAGQLHLAVGIGSSAKKPNDVEAAVDLRSILQFSGHDVRVEPKGDIEKVTGHSQKGSPVYFWIDRSLAMPLTALQLVDGTGKPAITLSRISVNQPIEGRFSLPNDAEIEKALPTKTYQKGVIDRSAITMLFVRSISYRAALTNPELRPQVERFTGKVDWEARKQQDAAIAAPLVKLLGQSIATTQPAK